MDKTLKAAGLKPEDIDVVIRTGGSSLIPAVQKMLEKKFGAEKVNKQEVFTSVVQGLAGRGRWIFRVPPYFSQRGLAEARAARWPGPSAFARRLPTVSGSFAQS